jgi:hypothetical protein
VAVDDDRVALIASSDCVLQDRIVHLGRTDDSHGLVARRLAAAAARMVYGRKDSLFGPQVEAARFGNTERTVVVVEFAEVQGSLRLQEEALGGFFASKSFSLPTPLADAPNPRDMPSPRADHLSPDAYKVFDNRIALRFSEPLPENATISWAATGHAAIGRGRRWRLEFARLTDDTGHQTPSFAALPIQQFAGRAVQVEGPSLLPQIVDPTRPIAVNFAKHPGGVLAINDVAGYGQWRQAYWNPTARFEFPNLFDDRGRVTDVSVSSYIHFGNFRSGEYPTPDDMLRAAGQDRHAEFLRLEPNTTYDLAIYTSLQGERPHAWADLIVSHPKPKAAKPGKPQPKPEKIVTYRIRVTSDTTHADAHGWQLAEEVNGWRGNVLLLRDVDSGPLGEISVEINAPPAHKADTPNPAKTKKICGMQIRLAVP